MNSDNKYVLAFVTPFIDELHGHNENSTDNIENYLLIDSIVELDDFYQYNIDEIKGFCLNMIYIFMQTTTNRNVINNYNRIYQHLLKSSVDIVEIIELEGQEEVACVKTFWLKCFQRRYKKYYKKKQEIIRKRKNPKLLLKRELLGKW